jgi:hypothetical protein
MTAPLHRSLGPKVQESGRCPSYKGSFLLLILHRRSHGIITIFPASSVSTPVRNFPVPIAYILKAPTCCLTSTIIVTVFVGKLLFIFVVVVLQIKGSLSLQSVRGNLFVSLFDKCLGGRTRGFALQLDARAIKADTRA